jgi:hypothetical protein
MVKTWRKDLVRVFDSCNVAGHINWYQCAFTVNPPFKTEMSIKENKVTDLDQKNFASSSIAESKVATFIFVTSNVLYGEAVQ